MGGMPIQNSRGRRSMVTETCRVARVLWARRGWKVEEIVRVKGTSDVACVSNALV
jgi:hypothetical protein